MSSNCLRSLFHKLTKYFLVFSLCFLPPIQAQQNPCEKIPDEGRTAPADTSTLDIYRFAKRGICGDVKNLIFGLLIPKDKKGLVTYQEKPTFYWFTSQPLKNTSLSFHISEKDEDIVIVDGKTSKHEFSGEAGIYSLSSYEYEPDELLEANIEYQISLSLICDSKTQPLTSEAQVTLRESNSVEKCLKFLIKNKNFNKAREVCMEKGRWYDVLDILYKLYQDSPTIQIRGLLKDFLIKKGADDSKKKFSDALIKFFKEQ